MNVGYGQGVGRPPETVQALGSVKHAIKIRTFANFQIKSNLLNVVLMVYIFVDVLSPTICITNVVWVSQVLHIKSASSCCQGPEVGGDGFFLTFVRSPTFILKNFPCTIFLFMSWVKELFQNKSKVFFRYPAYGVFRNQKPRALTQARTHARTHGFPEIKIHWLFTTSYNLRFLEDTRPFFCVCVCGGGGGGTDTPILDWWCLSWVSRPEWIAACFLTCVILRFTSGGTPTDLLEVNMAAKPF